MILTSKQIVKLKLLLHLLNCGAHTCVINTDYYLHSTLVFPLFELWIIIFGYKLWNYSIPFLKLKLSWKNISMKDVSSHFKQNRLLWQENNRIWWQSEFICQSRVVNRLNMQWGQKMCIQNTTTKEIRVVFCKFGMLNVLKKEKSRQKTRYPKTMRAERTKKKSVAKIKKKRFWNILKLCKQFTDWTVKFHVNNHRKLLEKKTYRLSLSK